MLFDFLEWNKGHDKGTNADGDEYRAEDVEEGMRHVEAFPVKAQALPCHKAVLLRRNQHPLTHEVLHFRV